MKAINSDKSLATFLNNTFKVSTAEYYVSACLYAIEQLTNGNKKPLAAVITVAEKVKQKSLLLKTLQVMGAKDHLTVKRSTGGVKETFKGFTLNYTVAVKPKQLVELKASLEFTDTGELSLSINNAVELEEREEKAEKAEKAEKRKAEKMANAKSRKEELNKKTTAFLTRLKKEGFNDEEVLKSIIEIAGDIQAPHSAPAHDPNQSSRALSLPHKVA